MYLLPIDCDITIEGTDTTRIQLVAVGALMHLMLSHFDTKTPIDEQRAFLLRIHYGSDQTHWTFLKLVFKMMGGSFERSNDDISFTSSSSASIFKQTETFVYIGI